MPDFCAYPERVEGYRMFPHTSSAEAYIRGGDFLRGWITAFYDTVAGNYPAPDMVTEAEFRASQ